MEEEGRTAKELFDEAIATSGRILSAEQEIYLKARFLRSVLRHRPLVDLSEVALAEKAFQEALNRLFGWFVVQMHTHPEEAEAMIRFTGKGRISNETFLGWLRLGQQDQQMRELVIELALVYQVRELLPPTDEPDAPAEKTKLFLLPIQTEDDSS